MLHGDGITARPTDWKSRGSNPRPPVNKASGLFTVDSGTGVSLTGFKPTRKHLQLSTDNKKLICCYKTLAFSDGKSFERSKKPSYWYAQGGVYGK